MVQELLFLYFHLIQLKFQTTHVIVQFLENQPFFIPIEIKLLQQITTYFMGTRETRRQFLNHPSKITLEKEKRPFTICPKDDPPREIP